MTEEKYDLQKQEKLKLFFYIARPRGIEINVPQEHPFYILAYSNDEAERKGYEYLHNQNAQDFVPKEVGNLNLDEIVAKLNLPEYQLVRPIVEQLKKEKIETTPKQFLYDLKLFVDDFVFDKGDKAQLKDFITRYEKKLNASKENKKSNSKQSTR